MQAIVLKILILGGTCFLGPHLVEEIKNRGHDVTLFNRGIQNASFFPDVENLYGDRDGDLSALEGRDWDAIIDTSGHLPRIVDASSKMLNRATNHYTFVSSVSAYKDFHHFDINEDDPVAQLEDANDEEITEKTYGALKAACEQVVQTNFPGRHLIVRPGLIVGPYDPTDRFTYWPVRINEGGPILVPGMPNRDVQFIDVRDLACWIVDNVERQTTGIYNVTGRAVTFERLLEECQRVCRTNPEYKWVSENFLISHHVQDWVELPLWLSSNRNMPGFFSISIERALQTGLKFRPLSETIAAVLDWNTLRHPQALQAGMDRDKERELLRLWNEESH